MTPMPPMPEDLNALAVRVTPAVKEWCKRNRFEFSACSAVLRGNWAVVRAHVFRSRSAFPSVEEVPRQIWEKP